MTNLAEVNRHEQTIGEVINFPNVKLKKDGTPKKTKSNAKENRDNVYPFKEEDIPKMVRYFNQAIEEATNDEDKLIRIRNKAMFIMGINIGLRCGDLVSLKWSDIYDKRFNFLSGKKIKPKKTRNQNKHVLLKYNEAFKRAISEYKDYIRLSESNLDDYIFPSRQGDHIGVRTVGNTIKKAAESVGINYNVNTHSMRKTFARVRYDHAIDKEKTLIELMQLFNHDSLKVTKHYICISEEELEELYNDVNLGFDD